MRYKRKTILKLRIFYVIFISADFIFQSVSSNKEMRNFS